MITFDWVSSKRLRNILLSNNPSCQDLSWALSKTNDAICDDEDNDMVSFEVLDYRDRSCKIAEYYFEKGNTNKCFKFLKNTWRV
jgi:hypothetical protein